MLITYKINNRFKINITIGKLMLLAKCKLTLRVNQYSLIIIILNLIKINWEGIKIIRTSK